MWDDLRTLSRYQTQALGSESSESKPLNCQGNSQSKEFFVVVVVLHTCLSHLQIKTGLFLPFNLHTFYIISYLIALAKSFSAVLKRTLQFVFPLSS